MKFLVRLLFKLAGRPRYPHSISRLSQQENSLHLRSHWFSEYNLRWSLTPKPTCGLTDVILCTSMCPGLPTLGSKLLCSKCVAVHPCNGSFWVATLTSQAWRLMSNKPCGITKRCLSPSDMCLYWSVWQGTSQYVLTDLSPPSLLPAPACAPIITEPLYSVTLIQHGFGTARRPLYFKWSLWPRYSHYLVQNICVFYV